MKMGVCGEMMPQTRASVCTAPHPGSPPPVAGPRAPTLMCFSATHTEK